MFFYRNGLEFVDSDHYINLHAAVASYIRHHSGNFELPSCHHKIYLGPLDMEDGTMQTVQRDVLNVMTVDIRKQVLDQIQQRSESHKWYPDLDTGVISSIDSKVANML